MTPDAILILFVFGFLIVLLVSIYTKFNNLKSEHEILKNIDDQKAKTIEVQNSTISEKSEEIEKLLIRNNNLSKYEPLIEVEQRIAELQEFSNNDIANKYANVNEEIANLKNMAREEVHRLINSTNDEVNKLLSEAKQELQDAKTTSADLKAKAETKAANLTKTADEVLNKAVIQSKEIIDNAKKKAEEIAGDAYRAMNNASEYEKVAKAMKNIIEGYGDEYIVPTYSLLDDLAEEFGHLEAGNQLKYSREKTRQMVKSSIAATCEYVEKNRKETAIEFVLDAFNGKVDSILSRVKKDNHGTLKQMILDAFELVNNNGKAFRNAVITQQYLDSRLAELKWAVVAQELKWEEQEEQRRIKEQLREEERARREYEKAIKEAQKNEETLKRLIEKAQAEVEHANAEQKQQYEDKLKDLEQKLVDAEEKNKRALSMAQQTRSGNVYIISNIGSFGEDVYKIGLTRRLEPIDRIRELGDASVPFEFDVHAMIFSEDAPTLEKNLHKKFIRMQMNKVNPRKEFFKVTLKEIREELDKLSINIKWTMTAEAKQYRESLALDRAIQNDQQKSIEWEQSQKEIISAESEDEFISVN